MDTKHTPGPWHTLCHSTNIEMKDARITVAGASRPNAYGGQVATVGWKDLSTEETEANARLIAAAPDLLSMLDRIIRRATTPLSDGGIAWDDVEKARELIARATGEKVEA